MEPSGKTSRGLTRGANTCAATASRAARRAPRSSASLRAPGVGTKMGWKAAAVSVATGSRCEVPRYVSRTRTAIGWTQRKGQLSAWLRLGLG